VRFLIISKNKYIAPPEVLSDLIDGTLAWTRKYQAQIKEIWSFAGQQAGAAIANVKSPEELDTMLAELPIRPFSETEVYPLVDLDASLRHQKESLHAMGVPA
jgi:muconolactone delta-isomerase